MFKVYDYISTKLLGKEFPQQDNASHESELTSFHLFSSLPSELRRKIWHLALPSRLIEASLDFQNEEWGCCYTPPESGTEDRRQLPVLFAVNIESREFCLEQYVPFANAYIHPKLDLLYISWQNSDLSFPRPRFYPIQDHALSRFHKVAMTIQPNNRSQERFGSLISILRHFGSPQEVLLCLVGPKRPSLFSTTKGFSISNGNMVVLLDWANKAEESISQEVQSHVLRALEAEKITAPGFSIPVLSERLYYLFSGP